MIAVKQPSAECNTIGLIIKLLWIYLVEIVKFTVFQYFCVKKGNAVDTMSIMHIHSCHMNPVILVDDGHLRIFVSFLHFLIQFYNDRKDCRCCLFYKRHRPLFQCFCQDRMIGIGTGFCYDGHRLFKINSFFHQ